MYEYPFQAQEYSNEYYAKLADDRASLGLVQVSGSETSKQMKQMKQRLATFNIGMTCVQGEVAVRLELSDGCCIYKCIYKQEPTPVYVLCTQNMQKILSWGYSLTSAKDVRDNPEESIPIKVQPIDTNGKWHSLEKQLLGRPLAIYEKIPGVHILCKLDSDGDPHPLCDLGVDGDSGRLMARERTCDYYLKWSLVEDGKHDICNNDFEHLEDVLTDISMKSMKELLLDSLQDECKQDEC